jgi:hypothetical protein
MPRNEVLMKADSSKMWCDGEMDKGRLFCTVINLNLTEFTVFQVVTAPSFCYFCAKAIR